jgi:hypothetical protein
MTETPPVRSRASRALARLVASRWTAVISVVVALALVATVVVVGVAKVTPTRTSVESDTAPTAFPSILVATTSPAVTRGQNVALAVRSDSAAPVAAVELWDGDHLYLRATNPSSIAQGGRHVMNLSLDYLPLVAGIHILMARVITRTGQVAQTAPVTAPILDAKGDVGQATAPIVSGAAEVTPIPTQVSIHTVPGDTVSSVARRLDVRPEQLVFDPTSEKSHFRFAPHSTASAPLVSRETAKAATPQVSPAGWQNELTASVADCTVTLKSPVASKLAVYASTPLQSGFVRVGDVSSGAPFTSATFPIGPSTVMVYKAGTITSTLTGDSAPSAPLSVVIPDKCEGAGWKGTAKVVNGMLITDTSVTNPYAYISVDQKTWQRVPAAAGQFLQTGAVNDLRSFITLDAFDQLNIEVWSSNSGTATLAGTGSFCRADMPNQNPAKSSKSHTACTPPGASPEDGTIGEGTALTLTATGASTIAPKLNLDKKTPTLTDEATDPSYFLTQHLKLSKDVPITFTAKLPDPPTNSRYEYQFTYFPISPGSPVTNPPGLLFSTYTSQPTITVHPWQWHDETLADLGSSSLSTSDGNLDLQDEMAASIARANLGNGKHLVDSLYVRVVEVKNNDGMVPDTSLGVASRSIEIDMADPHSYTPLTDPVAYISPGIDTPAPNQSLDGSCFVVDRYPTPGTYVQDPENDPANIGSEVSQYGAFRDQNDNVYGTNSDNAIAQRIWKQNTDYCLDPNAVAEREQDADNAAAAAQDDCNALCVLAAVAIGAVVGFAVGGPFGAVAGALLGGALALTAGPLVAQYEDLLKQFWDQVATLYNSIYSAVIDIVADFNPICLAAGAASASAQQACEKISEVAESAIVTAVTGLPPSLPLSSEIGALAKGAVTQFMIGAMDAGLGELGLSCDTFTLSGQDAELGDFASSHGGDAAKNALATAKTPDGSYSGCQALASVIVSDAQTQATDLYGTTVSGMMGISYTPGLVLDPVANTSPIVHVAAPAPTPAKGAETSCPVVANVTVHGVQNDIDDNNPSVPTYSTYEADFRLAPISGTLAPSPTDPGGPWSVDLSIPVLAGPYVQSGDSLGAALATGGITPSTTPEPYLRVKVDSPCFTQTLSFVAGYETTGDSYSEHAYIVDERPVALYH